MRWLMVAQVILLVCSGCGQGNEKQSAKARETAADSSSPTAYTDSLIIVLEGVDSVSVFDLTKADHTVESQASALGVFVTAIDAVENGDGYYWVYSVNGHMGTVASNRYITGSGDDVRWHFRRSGRR